MNASTEIPPADIFRAAANNDRDELLRALDQGQTLDDIDPKTSFSPVIAALIMESKDFLEAAMSFEFNPWYRDANQRMAIDHAAALGVKDVQRELYHKMYPPGWARSADVITPTP